MMNEKQRLKRPFVLASIMLAMFLSAIEATIVATAMPSIVADLQQFSMYSWIFSAYLLTSSVTILFFGKLADMYGRKPIFLIGLTVFMIGSLLAGSSFSMGTLIFARLIQGIGAGAIMPIATTIVGDLYQKEERGKVQGYLSSVWGISAIIGPLIGSFFVDFLHWRYIFLINIPLGMIALLGIVYFFKEDFSREKHPIDYRSFSVMIIFLIIIMFILVEGGQSIPWSSIGMIGLLLMAILAGWIFVYRQKNAAQPIFPFNLWKIRLLLIANIVTLLTGAIMISISSYLPTFVQGVMEQPALIAGFTLTTMSIGWPLASTISGRLLFHVGFRKISIIGSLFLLTGSLCFVFLHLYPAIWLAALGSFLIGVGMGTTSTAFIVSIQTTVAWNIRGIATATNMFMRSIGSAIGVAFLGGLLNSYLQGHLTREVANDQVLDIEMIDQILQQDKENTLAKDTLEILQDTLSAGLQTVYIAVFIIAIIATIFIYFLPRQDKN